MKKQRIWSAIFAAITLLTSMFIANTAYFYYQNKNKIDEVNKLELKAEESKKLIESNKYFADGFSAATNGNIDLAISLYQQALKVYPKNSDALHFLGYAEYVKWFNHKKSDSALLIQSQNDLKAAIELAPANTWAHYNFAIVLWQANKKSEAVDQLKILLGLDSTFKEKIKHDRQFKPFKESKEFLKLINSNEGV